MILRWPNKNWKSTYDSYINKSDVAATFLNGFNIGVHNEWDGISFYQEIKNGDPFGREYLIVSQNAWSCQRTIRFDNWTLIKTYHSGLKNFPEIMLFDFENDFHMTNNLAQERPEIVSKGLQFLNDWYNTMIKDPKSRIDPMDIVIKEGGPFHTRTELNNYINRLNRTGRDKMAKLILEKNESYLY